VPSHGDFIGGDKVFGDKVGRDKYVQHSTGNVVSSQSQGAQGSTPDAAALAALIRQILGDLPSVGLDRRAEAELREAGEKVLGEAEKPTPDPGALKRALLALKGLLAPIVVGVSTGAGKGAEDWARTAVEHLNPF
jgi:hypothetical protein